MNKLACVLWQAFEKEGKGSFRREDNARGARGGRENNVSAFRVISFTLSGIFLWLGNSAWHFFEFCPHSIIPVT